VAQPSPQSLPPSGGGATPSDPSPVAPVVPTSQGWLAPAINFRFQLLDSGKVDWDKADIETTDVTVYIDMTPQERQAALDAGEKQVSTILGLVATFYPPAATYIAIGAQVLDQLKALGVNFDGAPLNRRPSLCERTLGRGWHFVTSQMMIDADDDGIVAQFPALAGSSAWVIDGNNLFHHKHDFSATAGQSGKKSLELDGKAQHHAVCAVRNLATKP